MQVRRVRHQSNCIFIGRYSRPATKLRAFKSGSRRGETSAAVGVPSPREAESERPVEDITCSVGVHDFYLKRRYVKLGSIEGGELGTALPDRHPRDATVTKQRAGAFGGI